MFSLSISFGPVGTTWALLYRDEEKARTTLENITQAADLDVMVLADEFGQKLGLRRDSIHGFMLENLDETKLAHVERALHEARTRATVQQRAQQDSALRAASFNQGPSVLQPGMSGLATMRPR